ncbi:3-hydroxyacyl-ACP dehydratase FabZ family protein [Robiginitalea aurantiaca]|uniref:FabA/FabZ family ACP-dehydratase n=1 Tax=Robiginitalea aurantiaca TaxID=3056915 RepID=A0ABT7WFJ3_9FLAO|nr:FabA/FabZ family ACP-dehydratase [Robiginitalea aurantiaca]MDM9631690.1 FabA/FabZ family ACP-dehydratase [Robiginitalea aurantiaca]
MENAFDHIIAQLPYSSPFLFVDGLTGLTSEYVEGYYQFRPESDFYRGHFKDAPVTPGVILTECCAQIGLVCLGLHLIENHIHAAKGVIAMTESQMEFLKPVYPGEKVRVRGEKIYFRFNKLKAKVRLYTADGTLACKGQIAGILNSTEG